MSTGESHEVQRLREQVAALESERADLQRARWVESGRSTILERLASGAPLDEVLTLLVRTLEEDDPELIASVLVVDAERRLRLGAAPSLPDFYNAAVDGLAIGPAAGSCGTCAHTGERVIVEDVLEHPFWTDYRELAARAGVRACWSHPIASSTGRILGTFAMYYREPRGPKPSDLELITYAAHLAGIAIERARTEEALRESEQRFRTLVESAPVAMIEIDADLKVRSVNEVGLRMLGGARTGRIAGRPLRDLVAPADRERVESTLRDVLGGEAATLELSVMVDLGRRVLSASLTPLGDVAGNVTRIIGVAEDVTERKEAEERQQLLMQELDHRVKNNLATVLALTDQTLDSAESLPSFAETFRGRVRAMAIAHEMLARRRWRGVDLEELIDRLLGPYRREDGSRVDLDGAATMVPAPIASPICTVFHELAVNAGKYGALSDPAGRVRIRWRVEGPDLRVVWEETGGPPVRPPGRRGRGVDLIERMIEYQLGGATTLTFDPAGVRCEMTVPLDESADPDSGESATVAAPGTVTTRNGPRRLDGLRVLIVEDDFDVAESLSTMLTGLGCSIVGPVANADAACDLVKSAEVDAAVLDIALSRGTSAPVARSLQYRGCGFVFVTGYSDMAVLPEDLRGQRILLKPIGREELGAAIHELVGLS